MTNETNLRLKEGPMKTRFFFMTICLAITMIAGSQAFAHNIWINPENHCPRVGETVDIGIGWGHSYPAGRVDQEMKPGMFGYIRILDPDGMKVEPAKLSEKRYRLKIEKEGVYLVTAGIKPGVFTKTPQGRQWSDKKGVKNPISCTSFCIEAKTVIVAGANDKNLMAATGQELEIIPLSNPKMLKPGDELNLMVMFRGKPVPDVAVNATYAGFADGEKPKDIAPHRQVKGKKSHFPVTTMTDSQGKALIPLTKSGYWMIVISHKSPYPDKETCDEYMHNMAFTFQVQ